MLRERSFEQHHTCRDFMSRYPVPGQQSRKKNCQLRIITLWLPKGYTCTHEHIQIYWMTSIRIYFKPYFLKIFPGSTEEEGLSSIPLKEPIFASYLRILPYTWAGQIAMRFDVLGCYNGILTFILVCGVIP